MKLAIYGDAHITKNMRQFQRDWNDMVYKTFSNMYERFDDLEVECAVCLGDFFDKAVLEARSVGLVQSVLGVINSRSYPTFLLLGNHEIDSNEENILDFLSEYDNIVPVTSKSLVDNRFLFVPYNQDIEEIKDELSGKYVFTHHDIYGSELAGGLVKASFGINPDLLKNAHRVFNGHVHLQSAFGNVLNVGSITKSQHGELRYQEYPRFYILDSNNDKLDTYLITKDFIAYQDVKADQIGSLLMSYEESVKFVLRVSYDEESEIQHVDEYRSNPRILRLNLRKKISGTLHSDEVQVQRKTLDIKEVITSYISKDPAVDDIQKKRLIDMSMKIVGECQ